MGNNYDPTDYGMVELDRSDASRAGPGPDAESPEDILFESEAPSKPSPRSATGFPGTEAPAGNIPGTSKTDADHNWEALEEQLEDRDSEPAGSSPPPAAKSGSLPSKKSSGPRARLTPRPPRIHHYRPPPQPSSWLVPMIVVSLGFGTGACMFLFFQNLPLGGLAAALGVTGALFTRVLLRGR